MKFLADEMCKNIARWLRMLGYDTTYAKDYESKYGIPVIDTKIIDICFEEYRILVTRDREMIKNMESRLNKLMKSSLKVNPKFKIIIQNENKIILPCILLKTSQLIDEMAQIRRKFGIRLVYDSFFARCPQCNTKIMKIDINEEYKEKIPEKVYKYHKDFWLCTNKKCSKIYWMGKHFTEILQKLEKIQMASE